MTGIAFDADVIVVGAGLAGAQAARDLTRRGKRVRLLEARSRAGGRAFSRPFAGGSDRLDFGGGWVMAAQPRIHALAAELGLGWRRTLPVTTRRWLRSDGLSDRAPAADMAAYEATLARIAADSQRYKAGHALDPEGRPLLGASLTRYLERLAPDADARAQLEAWWCLSGNGDPAVVTATDLLACGGYGDGRPESLLHVMGETPAEGAQALAEGLLREAGLAVDCDSPVLAVEQDASGARVRLRDGRHLTAGRVLLATGINPLRDLGFAPPLAGNVARAVGEGHHGRAVKLWLRAEGVPLGALATGAGPGLRWLFAERPASAGGVYLVGFGLTEIGRAPNEAYAEAALRAFFPAARLTGWDWHDWVLDPWSQGTWVATPAARPRLFDWSSWQPQGRLHFASSDFAPASQGWFEGALEAGAAAAAMIAAAGA